MVWRDRDIMTVCCPEEHKPVFRIHRSGRPYVPTASILTLRLSTTIIGNKLNLLVQDGIHFEMPYDLTSLCVERLETTAVSVHFDRMTEVNQPVEHRRGGKNPGPVVWVRLAVLFLGIATNHSFPE
jgi:hypothetical protein